MLNFMDQVQHAFLTSTSFPTDNSYVTLSSSARALLNFPTPLGLRLHLSSFTASHFANSYTLGSLGVVDGSLSFLYSTLPLTLPSSKTTDLRSTVLGYRQHDHLRAPTPKSAWRTWLETTGGGVKPSLLYGRMYLPESRLEALYMRMLSPSKMLRVTAVSDRRIRHGGTILAMVQHDVGKWNAEYLYSSDVALLGLRCLYNFGRDPRTDPVPVAPADNDKPIGRFSAGAELYYGVLNKSAGVSTGVRYTTLPPHPGIPLTMTLTLNPLMGHVAATYAVQAGARAAFASRFDFNVYSYESDVSAGIELWRREARGEGRGEGVLKATLSSKGEVGVCWEGRVKELLFSVGGTVGPRGREGQAGGVKRLGVEVMYSS